MNNTYEIIENMKQTYDTVQEITFEEYNNFEDQAITAIINIVNNAEVECKAYGIGRIMAVSGTSVENLIVDIEFDDITKRFSLKHITIVSTGFAKIVDQEIIEEYNKIYELHTNITANYKASEVARKQKAFEAKLQAKANAKAEERYQKLKDKAIKDFETLQNRAKTDVAQADEFYYSLGWLTNHVGSISAVLPDYLEKYFTAHFGPDTSARIVDSKKRTVNGNSMQWTFGFKASLKKANDVPVALSQYLSTTGKAIASTSFIWDLVDTYGFKFGKKQDINQIKQNVPAQYIASFESGFTA